MLALPYARFLQVAKVINEAEAREDKERYKRLAYVGWLTSAKEGVTYGAFLDALGLGEQPQPEQVTKKAAMVKAAAALEKLQGVLPKNSV